MAEQRSELGGNSGGGGGPSSGGMDAAAAGAAQDVDATVAAGTLPGPAAQAVGAHAGGDGDARAREVADALGVTLDEARGLIVAGAMDAWEVWPGCHDVGDGSADDETGARCVAGTEPCHSADTRRPECASASSAASPPWRCDGRFVRAPEAENDWHRGDIMAVGTSSWEWVNDAGARWGLSVGLSVEAAATGPGAAPLPDRLATDEANPYRAEHLCFVDLRWAHDAAAGVLALVAFRFGQDVFERLGPPGPSSSAAGRVGARAEGHAGAADAGASAAPFCDVDDGSKGDEAEDPLRWVLVHEAAELECNAAAVRTALAALLSSVDGSERPPGTDTGSSVSNTAGQCVPAGAADSALEAAVAEAIRHEVGSLRRNVTAVTAALAQIGLAAPRPTASAPTRLPTWRDALHAAWAQRRRCQHELHKRWASAATEVVNPPDDARAFSSVHKGDAAGTGHAHSALDSPQAWSAGKSQAGECVTLDLGSHRAVVGFVLQGRRDADQWVTMLRVETSDDGCDFAPAPGGFALDGGGVVGNGDGGGAGGAGVFDGVGGRGAASRRLSRAVRARWVRFTPLAWHGHVSLRVALVCLRDGDEDGGGGGGSSVSDSAGGGSGGGSRSSVSDNAGGAGGGRSSSGGGAGVDPALALFMSDLGFESRESVVAAALEAAVKADDASRAAAARVDEARAALDAACGATHTLMPNATAVSAPGGGTAGEAAAVAAATAAASAEAQARKVAAAPTSPASLDVLARAYHEAVRAHSNALKEQAKAGFAHAAAHLSAGVLVRADQGPHGAAVGAVEADGVTYTHANTADPAQSAEKHASAVTWSCLFPFLFAAALNAVGVPALTRDELDAWARVFALSAAEWPLMVARVAEGSVGTGELSAEYWFAHSAGGTARFHPGGEEQSRLVLDRVPRAGRVEHMRMVNATAAELVQAGWVGGPRDDCRL